MKPIDENISLKDRSVSIRHVMHLLNKSGQLIVFFLEEDGSLFGCVTDGDLRQGILNGMELTDSVESVINRKPLSIKESDLGREGFIESLMQNNYISRLPVLNDEGRAIGVLSSRDYLKMEVEKLPNPVVVMAGGKGTRMKPFTNILPKALIPIEDKPILQMITERFFEGGFSDFYISVNFMKDMIKSYFSTLQQPYQVKYLEEDSFCGTAGSLKKLGDVENDVFVINCDTIVSSDPREILEFHKREGASITIVSAMRHIQIPYGTIELSEKGDLLGVKEKPEHNVLINTGFYVLSPDVLDLIPEDTFFHMTDLIQAAMDRGSKISTFPLRENQYFDIGQWDSYEKTTAVYRQFRES